MATEKESLIDMKKYVYLFDDYDEILESLEHPSWNRLFHIYDAFKLGIPFNTIMKLTKIDKWFLKQIEELIDLEKEIEQYTIDNF